MNMQETNKEKRFIDLYKSYIDEVYQFIDARSGYDSALAEDITQDIFLDVFRGLDKFKGLCSERSWIYKIARNKLTDFYRKQYGQTFEFCGMDEARQIYDPAQDIEMQMEKSFESRLIRKCLGTLPAHYRITLLMKYVDGKTVKQIAEIANKSLKATESLLQRAKEAFIKEYQLSKKKEEC
jgi:RNA polymerase sigma-70 factor (ECF subfamily)